MRTLRIKVITLELIYFTYLFLNFFTNPIFHLIGDLRFTFMVLSCLFSIVGIIAVQREKSIQFNKMLIAFIFFTLSTLIGEMYQFSLFGVEELSSYIRKIIFVPVVVFVFQMDFKNLLSKIFEYSIILTIVQWIAYFLIGFNENAKRFTGIFIHGNYLSFYCMTIILICAYRLMKNEGKKLICYFVFISALFFLVQAGSRTSFAITLFLLLILCAKFFFSQKRFLYLFILLPLVIILVFILIRTNWDTISQLRILNLKYGLDNIDALSGDNSFIWRVKKWQLSFENWRGLMPVMFGFGNGGEIFFPFYGFAMHNDYLRWIFDYGIVGILFILKISIEFIKGIVKMKGTSEFWFYFLFCISILISAFSSNLFYVAETYHLYILIIFSVTSLRKEKSVFN